MGSVVLSLNSIAHFILHPAENSQLGLGALQVEPVYPLDFICWKRLRANGRSRLEGPEQMLP